MTTPRHLLLVVHSDRHSGPLRSIAPRLRTLRAGGTKITTLVPRTGPAAVLAQELGEVLTAGPSALVLPRSPLDLPRIGRSVLAERRMVRAIATERGCDVAVLTSVRLPGAVLGARSAGCGLVAYAGEPRAESASSRLGSRLLALAIRRSAGVVIAPSRASASWQADLGFRPTVLTPAVELEGLDEGLADRARAMRRELGIDDGEPVVASLGAINRSRGQDLLIAAVQRVAERGGGCTLLIGGEPFDFPRDLAFASELRRGEATHAGPARVVFAGPVADVAAFLASADVFANPARVNESFGRAACEALLAGTPVVTSATAVADGILEEERTALVVEPDRPKDLARAITRLLEDRELRGRLVEAGAARVRERCAGPSGQGTFEACLSQAVAARHRLP